MTGYVGRFAPTPSGLLHFGSLLSALASFLDARAASGRWLVRMEDLDTPRNVPGAADAILATLEQYGLYWDGPVVYQSQRHAAYKAVLDDLLARGWAYPCQCSRNHLVGQSRYPGYCRDRQLSRHGAAIRLRAPDLDLSFQDRCQGHYQENLARDCGDFIIQRRDGICAYQLAVVVDDAWQGISDVVRGADLLDSTPRQILLQQSLQLPTPRYLHLPLVLGTDGRKLAKRDRSPPLGPQHTTAALHQALQCLGQESPPDLMRAPASDIVAWAISNWDSQRIPACRTLALPTSSQ